MVIPAAEDSEIALGRSCRRLKGLPELPSRFQGAEETLDAAILPRRKGCDPLVANAQERQSPAKEAGAKYRLVIGADDFRLAESIDHLEELAKQLNIC